MTSDTTKLSGEALLAELDRLRAQNAKLQEEATASAARALSFKVSEKGALSVYGLGRLPVTLYAEQWERLLPKADEILRFIANNPNRLSRK